MIYSFDIDHNAGIENMIPEQLSSGIVTTDPDHFCTLSLSHMHLMNAHRLTEGLESAGRPSLSPVMYVSSSNFALDICSKDIHTTVLVSADRHRKRCKTRLSFVLHMNKQFCSGVVAITRANSHSSPFTA